MRIRLRLFWEMFRIALFVIGGGFAILAVADEVFGRRLKWLKEGELLEQLPIFQMVPGIIAGNTAVYVGWKLAGWSGAAIALLGTVTPSIVVFSAVTIGYDSIPVNHPLMVGAFAGLRAALAGIIASMLVKVWRKSVQGWYGYSVFALVVFAVGVFQLPAVVMVVGAALAGIVLLRPQSSSSVTSEKRFQACGWLLIFFGYGLVAFGGGYVLVPLYLQDFVGESAKYLQLTLQEFGNVMALTQITPGPISINCATYFGYRLAGLPGACAATFAVVLPGYFLLLWLLWTLERGATKLWVQGLLAGVRPVTAALMAVALATFGSMSAWMPEGAGSYAFHWRPALLLVIVGVLFHFRKVRVVPLILCSALLNMIDF